MYPPHAVGSLSLTNLGSVVRLDGRKKQKRGLVNNLASLKKELWSVNFAKKSK
jgi:hypothetical protein